MLRSIVLSLQDPDSFSLHFSLLDPREIFRSRKHSLCWPAGSRVSRSGPRDVSDSFRARLHVDFLVAREIRRTSTRSNPGGISCRLLTSAFFARAILRRFASRRRVNAKTRGIDSSVRAATFLAVCSQSRRSRAISKFLADDPGRRLGS
jgi:hypothetical protein